ncbi:uncharacterized protein BDZ99DRAFT_570411 [Mytilinidion resinicola]|uniref:Uncharacterized protein n=1 Tax=Mytilinidion resinicola TaxID=574789 RepID=A0A6A6YTB9_9PEZI|nr:uncharacterized protein BDZ99DRAFT_570411 [Mytilinidion resinicola]KAF2811157.1 hypothetical protein BDZ99DRAFT_570411 [Mytilinidion resinicola]
MLPYNSPSGGSFIHPKVSAQTGDTDGNSTVGILQNVRVEIFKVLGSTSWLPILTQLNPDPISIPEGRLLRLGHKSPSEPLTTTAIPRSRPCENLGWRSSKT